MNPRHKRFALRRLSEVVPQNPREGFTFAEMLLVMALLLIITGVVFPPVLRMMSDQPLKEGTEKARQQLATVRVRALDSSVSWQFRFEPGGRKFLWMPEESLASGPVNSSGSSSPSNVTSASASVAASLQTGELPNGIQFASDVDGIPFGIERLPQELLAGRPDSYQLTQTGWSSPLVFLPDGSTTDFELAVVDARNRQMRLTLRGLTGGVTVSPIEPRRRR